MSTNRMLLTDYLAEQISKREMYRVIFQITEALLATEGNRKQVDLDINLMELEDGRVIIDYQNDAPNTIDKITLFFKELVFHCVFRYGEVLDDLTDFLEFLDNKKEVTLTYIYEYVADELDIDVDLNFASGGNNAPEGGAESVADRNAGRTEDYTAASRSTANHSSVGNSTSPRYEAASISNQGETGVLDVNFWQQNKLLQEADKIQRNSQRLSNINNGQSVRPSAHTVSSNDETGVLDESFWATQQKNIAVASHSQNDITRTILLNEKSGEEIKIQKDLFIIGKDSSVADLVINNKTISRNHAEISIRGTHYFIKDNGSTNKTYVDGKEIPANTNVEIYNGSTLKFSNEIYRFIVR